MHSPIAPWPRDQSWIRPFISAPPSVLAPVSRWAVRKVRVSTGKPLRLHASLLLLLLPRVMQHLPERDAVVDVHILLAGPTEVHLFSTLRTLHCLVPLTAERTHSAYLAFSLAISRADVTQFSM